MDTLNEIRRRAEHLVAYAQAMGVVLTVEQVPLRPLAMGNHRTEIHLRPARHAPAAQQDALAALYHVAKARVEQPSEVRKLAQQFQCHPVSRGIDEIERAGELLVQQEDEITQLKAMLHTSDVLREKLVQERDALRARLSQQDAHAVSQPSPTAGMNIAQRILHVGGRNNAAGYVEFGSIQAVEALVRQAIRDLPVTRSTSPAAPTPPEQQDEQRPPNCGSSHCSCIECPDSWAEAEAISNLPAVDEAIRNLLDDHTGDNATAVVLAVLSAAKQGGAGQ